MIKQRLLKISYFFLIIMIVLSACNNPTTKESDSVKDEDLLLPTVNTNITDKESNSVKEENLSLPIVNTNITEYVVAITGVNNETRVTANKQLFSLGNNRFLTVLENASGYAYDVFDLRIPSIRLSNKLDFDTVSKVKPVEVEWIQLANTKFLIKNPNDKLEAYIWVINDTQDKIYGEEIYRLPLVDNFVDYAINSTANTFLEISTPRDQIQIYGINLGDNTELNLHDTLTKEQLKLSTDSELKQVAFLNNNDFVYTWNIKGQTNVGGYGMYSLKCNVVTLLKDNDANDLIFGNDAIIIAKDDMFTYIHESGLSTVVTQQDIAFTMEAIQNAHVSNGYIVFSYKSGQYWACINPFQKHLSIYFKMDLDKQQSDVDLSNATTTINMPDLSNIDNYIRWNIKPEIAYLAPASAPNNESKMLSIYKATESKVMVRNMKFEVMPPEEFDKLLNFIFGFSENNNQDISTIGELVDAMFEFNIVKNVQITNLNSNLTISIERSQKNTLTQDERNTKLVPDTDYKVIYNYNPGFYSDSEISINR